MQIHGYSHNCWKGFDDWHSAQAWLTEGATQQQNRKEQVREQLRI